MLVHFGFLVFVTLGGFLAWRWRRLIWVHLAVSAWAFVIVVFGPPCPLTGIENWARTHAGETPLHGTGFIDNYLEGVVYPARYTGLLQALVALAVVMSWVGYVIRGRGVRRREIGGRDVRGGGVRRRGVGRRGVGRRGVGRRGVPTTQAGSAEWPPTGVPRGSEPDGTGPGRDLAGEATERHT